MSDSTFQQSKVNFSFIRNDWKKMWKSTFRTAEFDELVFLTGKLKAQIITIAFFDYIKYLFNHVTSAKTNLLSVKILLSSKK